MIEITQDEANFILSLMKLTNINITDPSFAIVSPLIVSLTTKLNLSAIDIAAEIVAEIPS